MRKAITALRAVIIGLLVSVTAFGQDAPDPNIGKTAPPLKVKAWATGKTIADADLAGKPYVLEFWATWCPPCRRSIPHLNQLSQQVEPFGVPVIGLSDEAAGTVKPFVAKMGMSYFVGVNDGTKLTHDGIPFAAVVGPDKKIVWAGHPMSPEFEENVFKVTMEHGKELASAVVAARAGDLGKAHAELGKSKAPAAKQALTVIAANLKARLAHAGTLEGLEKYSVLNHTASAYDGVPGADAIGATLAKLEADPEIKKAVTEQHVMEALEASIQGLQQKAAELEKEQSQEAAAKFYFGEMIPLLTKFVADNPDHRATADLQKGIKTLQDAVKKMEAAKEAEAATPGEGG